MKKKLELLLAAMSKLSGMSKAEITAKLDFDEATTDEAFDTALDEVLDAHSTKVTKKQGIDYSDGHKAAKKEVLETLESDLKTKFGVTDSNKKGIALIEQIVEASKGKGGDAGAIDDDAVKKHPLYLQLEKDSQKALSDAKTEADTKLKELTTGLTLKEATKKLVDEGLVEFDNLAPILGDSDTAKAKRRAQFAKALEQSIKLELTETGDTLLIGENGKRLEDKHGNRQTVKDLVKPLADDLGFEYHAAKPRTSSGVGAGGTGTDPKDQPTKAFTGTMPAKGDQKAYMSLLADDKLSDEAKTEVAASWAELNK